MLRHDGLALLAVQLDLAQPAPRAGEEHRRHLEERVHPIVDEDELPRRELLARVLAELCARRQRVPGRHHYRIGNWPGGYYESNAAAQEAYRRHQQQCHMKELYGRRESPRDSPQANAAAGAAAGGAAGGAGPKHSTPRAPTPPGHAGHAGIDSPRTLGSSSEAGALEIVELDSDDAISAAEGGSDEGGSDEESGSEEGESDEATQLPFQPPLPAREESEERHESEEEGQEQQEEQQVEESAAAEQESEDDVEDESESEDDVEDESDETRVEQR